VVARALADVARGAQAASDRSGDGTAASGAARLAAGTADGTEGLKPVEPAERQAGWEDRPHGEDSAAGKEGATPKTAATAAEGTSASVARDGPHAPPAPLGPSQQVAGRIVAAAVAAQQAGTAIDASGTKAISAPVVKVLHLELQPADLGTITVRMSLKQDALDIRLEASRHDTAVALQNDQDGLAKLLASAGYRIDGVTIATNAANAAQASDSRAPGSFASSMPGQWDASQSDPRSSGGRQDALPDPRASHGRQNDDTDRSSASRGSSGDLYV
jgi:chemotaxis protein MotD